MLKISSLRSTKGERDVTFFGSCGFRVGGPDVEARAYLQSRNFAVRRWTRFRLQQCPAGLRRVSPNSRPAGYTPATLWRHGGASNKSHVVMFL
ncbi:hypothetical protein L1887_52852 [Cichorium endivia]|nr:hypothetical protein L1887_52852 [Cichorium endivia]